MKIRMMIAAVCMFLTSSLFAQKLFIRDLDAQRNETGTRTVEIGDVIVVAYQKKPGKPIHYFQGKVTGIFKDRGKIRVFDYGRSTRFMSIVGKKIKVNQIVGIKMMDRDDYETRQDRAVIASIATAVGAGMGGDAGNAVEAGGSAANTGNDLLTREHVSKQRIKIEFREY